MRTRKMIAALLALAVAGCDSQPTDPTPDEPTPAALGAATESNFEAVVGDLIPVRVRVTDAGGAGVAGLGEVVFMADAAPGSVVEVTASESEVAFVALGDTLQLTALAADEHGDGVEEVGFIWSSSDTTASGCTWTRIRRPAPRRRRTPGGG